MPEIVDLEVSRRNMLRKVRGRRISGVDIKNHNILKNCKVSDIHGEFMNKKLQNISRKGKILVFETDHGKIAVHLMLTGNFVWQYEVQKENEIMMEMTFETEDAICITDPKLWVKVEIETKDIESSMMDKKLGVDPLSENFTEAEFLKLLEKKKRCGIKSFLIDQKNLAGIGNAYSDEILWSARIHPSTKISEIIVSSSVKDLYIAIKDVIEASISKVEELSKNESISEQSRDFMSVYRKESQSCPRCGNIISQIKVAGRDTFVCSVCQKI